MDRGALEAFIAAAAGAGKAQVSRLEPLTGGAIQENWALDATLTGGARPGPLEAVLRADARSRVPISHDRAQEFALLRAAFETGVRVPEPLWLCTDTGVIGRAFFLMGRVGGSAAGHRLVKDATLDGARLVGELAAQLAGIHTITPPRADLNFLPAPKPSPALYWIERFRDWLDSDGHPRPALEWGLRWLERNAPPAGETVLCHHDFRTGNYLVDGGALAAVLDWEFAGWGEPEQDIGWFCAKCWRFGANQHEAGGLGAREDFTAAYEAASGRAVDAARVAYWEVMAHVRWAVIACQQADRHLSGAEPSLELALTAHVVPELELEILKLTEKDM